MFKKLTIAAAALLVSVLMFAQATYTGGVKGTVISRNGKAPVSGASLTLMRGAEQIATSTSTADGTFYFQNLADGMYDLIIAADEYMQMRVNVTVNGGYVKNMFNLSMSPASASEDLDDSNFAEFDMNDSGYSDSPVILFGQNDVYNNIASFNFSDVRFKTRGYNSETQDVYLAGVKLNDAITGYSPYSLWSGLNEATRTKDSANGLDAADFGNGGYNGMTNINAMASSVRSGMRASVMTNSAYYRLRIALSYASGVLDNGWSYAFNVSSRLGGNDWVKGVYYKALAYYGSVEKRFGDEHRLGFAFMASPGERGSQNASTQEVYDLVGDNMYNSNWGYCNGKVRNSRIKKSHEPIAILKYDYTPSAAFNAGVTALVRFGWNGSTALDWYNSADPRPDYYRNLPSYFYVENADYGRESYGKYLWAKEAWQKDLESTTHVNWDRMYLANITAGAEGERRSNYVLEERRTEQRDFNLAGTMGWHPSNSFSLNGGLALRANRTEYYKKLADLLGGDYYIDAASFAEREYKSAAKIQNNLDYFLENGTTPVLHKGDKFGYDYYAQVRNANVWANASYTLGGLKVTGAAQAGYTAFWRDGIYRKGLFPGLDSDNSSVLTYMGDMLTTFDPVTGRVITSKGKSDICEFFTYSFKGGLQYFIKGGHKLYANAGFFSDAPTFNQAFVSPRTRYTLIPNLDNHKTASFDVNYAFSNGTYSFRVTGFYTAITDLSDVMSFYDDSQNSFTNFAMCGMDERHTGVEMGFSAPLPVKGLSLRGALSIGEYIYTSNPKMYQTVDNSASIVSSTYGVTIPYWKSSPVFEKDANGAYVLDSDDYPVVKKERKHYLPSTPQKAGYLGLSYNKNYWFIDLGVSYYRDSYLDMNPLYRTDMATSGPDGMVTPAEVEYMTAQEKFDPVALVNLSVGKSWYIRRKYQIGFNLNAKNLTNRRDVKTGGYEQTRLIDSANGERYYRFDSKYFYMAGANYMLNIYCKF